MTFVGRTAELALVDAVVAEARAGHAASLRLRGPRGIGKTALLDEAARRASDLRALRVRGLASESALDYGGLHALLRPVMAHLSALPAPQARAVEAALALAAGVDDRLAVLAGTLGLLAAGSREGPLLVIVDDAHLLDRPTQDALLFTARRLADEPIAVLVGQRADKPSAFDESDVDAHDIGGLDLPAARALLEGLGVADAVVERLWRETAGNPAALLALPGSLEADERSGRTPLAGGPLPAATRVRRLYSSRVARLGPDARRALLIAAASDEGSMETIADAMAEAGADPALLHAAEREGIVSIEDGSVAFADPLERSAVYYDAAPSERREAHDALARALATERDDDRRAWHRAAAASEADEEVAADLERAALRARRRGGVAVEAMALARAARLTPAGPARLPRLLAAAAAARRSGRLAEGAGLLEDAAQLAGTPAERARVHLERAHVLAAAGAEADAALLLEQDGDRLATSDPAAALEARCRAALLRLELLDVDGAVRVVEEARSIAAPADPAAEARLATALGSTLHAAGEGRAASIALARAAELFESGDGGDDAPALAVALAADGHIERGRSLLLSAAEQHRTDGDVWSLHGVLVALGEVERRAGRLPIALTAAREAMQLADALDAPGPRRRAAAALALVEAAQGRELDCRAHAELAAELAAEHEHEGARARGDLALGLLALAAGAADEAVERLSAAGRRARAGGLRDVATLPWAPLLIEALLAAGADEDAAREHAALADATRAHRGEGRALALRAGALVGVEPRASLDEAIELLVRAQSRFEEARTRLALGEHLVATAAHAEARAELRLALEQLEAMRAEPWAERARAGLRACGEIARRENPRVEDLLTPQELQVALVVAEGASNKDVASRLFLSPKTVEYHLRNAFRKLDVRSRTELASRLAAERAPARRP